MLILPNSCFLHVAKTGGSWVKKAIKASGIEYEEYSIDGNPHIGLSECPVPDKFKFAFVRHPIDLYRSYWQFKMTNEWDVKNQLDMDCKSDKFNEFIGKYENLVEDLIIALKQAHEVFNEEAIRKLPPYNVSDKTRFPAKYTKELEDEVRKIEINVIERFGYN